MDKFKSLEELYNVLLPALKLRVDEINIMVKGKYSPIDLWNYLILFNWRGKKELYLYKLVDDILSINEIEFIDFQKRKIKSDRELQEL